MPASDRPRRSARNKSTIEEAEAPPPPSPKKTKIEGDGDGLLYDSDTSEDKPWLDKAKAKSKLKKKSSTPDYENGNEKDKEKDKPIIPKRKRDSSSVKAVAAAAAGNPSSSPPPKDEIKRKKKDDSAAATNTLKVDNKLPTSSLIANMAPVFVKKQPVLRDWQPTADFKKVKRDPKSASVPKTTGSKTPLPRNQQQQQQQKNDPVQDLNRSNHGNGISKRMELEQKIRKDLNTLIFEVLEGKGRINSNSAMKIEDLKEKSNVIDCHGSFLPTDDQEHFDFGDLEQDRPIPMFPEDFSSKQKQWPLSWWGIMPPSDEVLDMHDGRSRSRGSRERSSKDVRHKDREIAGDKERDRDRDRERALDRDRGPWRDEREQRGAPPPFRGDGWHNNYDYRAGPPPTGGPGGHYGPPPPRERGGWDDPRMNEERRRGGGGGGRGFGPGGPGPRPSRGGYGPGPGPFPRR